MTFSVKDIRLRYAVSEGTVLGWIANHELKAINCGRQPGKKKPRWRITEEALAAFEAGRMTNPPPPRTRRRKASAGVIEFYR